MNKFGKLGAVVNISYSGSQSYPLQKINDAFDSEGMANLQIEQIKMSTAYFDAVRVVEKEFSKGGTRAKEKYMTQKIVHDLSGQGMVKHSWIKATVKNDRSRMEETTEVAQSIFKGTNDGAMGDLTFVSPEGYILSDDDMNVLKRLREEFEARVRDEYDLARISSLCVEILQKEFNADRLNPNGGIYRVDESKAEDFEKFSRAINSVVGDGIHFFVLPLHKEVKESVAVRVEMDLYNQLQNQLKLWRERKEKIESGEQTRVNLATIAKFTEEMTEMKEKIEEMERELGIDRFRIDAVRIEMAEIAQSFLQ